MAVNKVLSSTSFHIEAEAETDKTGAKIYKKTFSGVRPTATPQKV